MKVLVACEESQAVCIAFRERGHEAYSCDLQECSGGHPEWHICGDCIQIIGGGCEFITMDGKVHRIDGKWDLLIAHPPCTYLSVAGAKWFDIETYGNKALKRIHERECAVEFFMRFVNAECDRIAIENPIGTMSTRYRKPDQIIQPFMFGHHESKKTCLWLKGVPLLKPTDIVESHGCGWGGWNGGNARDVNGKILAWNSEEIKRLRSKTFPGIASAMAEQWGNESNTNSKYEETYSQITMMELLGETT